MAEAMTLISTVTVGAGGAASIDFTSIPATYTDLMVVHSLRASLDSTDVLLRFNSSTTDYSMRMLYGTGSSAASVNNSSSYLVWAGFMNPSTFTSSTFGSSQLYIPNYSGSSQKSISVDGVTENNSSTAYQMLAAGLWANTSAITSLTFSVTSSGSFVQYSTASLYGILKGSGGATVS